MRTTRNPWLEAAYAREIASGEVVSWASGLPSGVLWDVGVSGLLWFRVRNNYELVGSYWEYSSDPAKGSASRGFLVAMQRFGPCYQLYGNASHEVLQMVCGLGLAETTPSVFT